MLFLAKEDRSGLWQWASLEIDTGPLQTFRMRRSPLHDP